MQDYPNPTPNVSNPTWAAPSGQVPYTTNNNSNTSTSFNSYTMNKWGSHNSSQSSTPTNPTTLPTTFPSCMYFFFLSILSLHIIFVRKK